MIGFVINSILLGVGLAMDAFSVSIANGLNEPGMRHRRACLIAGVYAFFQFLMPVIGWFCVHELVRTFRAFEPWIPWIALALLLWIGGKMLLEGIRDLKDGGSSGNAAAAAGSGASNAAGTSEEAGASEGTGASNAAGAPEDTGASNAAGTPETTGAREAGLAEALPAPRPSLTMAVLLLQGIATSIDALSVGFAIAHYTWVAALVCALIIAAVTFVICIGGLAAGRKLGEKLAGKAGILGGCILIFIGVEIFVRGVFL